MVNSVSMVDQCWPVVKTHGLPNGGLNDEWYILVPNGGLNDEYYTQWWFE